MQRFSSNVFIIFVSACSCLAAAPSPGKGASAAQVQTFQVHQGVDLPQEYLDAITTNLVKELIATRKFSQVFGPAEAIPAGTPVLQLSGTIIKFRKGSRATRALVGGLVGALAGRTEITIHLKFTDSSTQQVKTERDFTGTIAGDWIGGGASIKATEDLAKRVAKEVKKEF